MQHLFLESGRTLNSVLPWICKVCFLNSKYVCVLKIKTHESSKGRGMYGNKQKASFAFSYGVKTKLQV